MSPRVLSAVLLAASANGFAQIYLISTAVGAGPPNNVVATSTGLQYNTPTYLTADGAGDVFFVQQNSVIERSASTGLLTVVAGTGYMGYSGDNGPATGAQLNNPGGLAVDSAGDVYIADTGNSVIRKVSNGVITTVAGTGKGNPAGSCPSGPALSTNISSLTGLAFDSKGNLYISDPGDFCILELSGSTITVVAGSGVATNVPNVPTGDGGPATAATFSYTVPSLAVDSSGNVYIADTGNLEIREVNIATGNINSVAGNGTCCTFADNIPATTAPLSDPFGVAVDSSGDIFISETGFGPSYSLVREVVSGTIHTVAGDHLVNSGFSGDGNPATLAQLNLPQAIALDGSGNLYIADQNNNRIRKVSGGTINTIVGNGSVGDGGLATGAQLDEAYSLGLDPSGNLYIADNFGERVRKVTNSTGIITTVAGNGTSSETAIANGTSATAVGLNNPSAVAADGKGNVYIANTFSCTILDVVGGFLSNFAGDGTCGYTSDGIPATQAEIGYSFGLAVDSLGNVYLSDWVENTSPGEPRVREVSGGNINTVAGNGLPASYNEDGSVILPVDGSPATSAALSFPSGLAVDSHNNLYIADIYLNVILEVSGGNIYVVAGNGNADYSGDGGPATEASLNNPGGVAVDSQGNIYIADTYNNAIRMVNATTGNINTIAGNGVPGYSGDYGPATSAEISDPFDVVVNSAGGILFGDSLGHVRLLTSATSSDNCAYSVSSPYNISATGGALTIPVTTTAFCRWGIFSLPSWITLAGAADSTGPGNAALSVAANTGSARSATITIAGTSVMVSQAGTGTANLCDINNDDVVNVKDVLLVLKQALGFNSPGSDLNTDGRVNVVDIQIDLNAALGHPCFANQ